MDSITCAAKSFLPAANPAIHPCLWKNCACSLVSAWACWAGVSCALSGASSLAALAVVFIRALAVVFIDALAVVFIGALAFIAALLPSFPFAVVGALVFIGALAFIGAFAAVLAILKRASLRGTRV